MNNITAPSQNQNQNQKTSPSSKLKPAQLIALIITAILIIAVIIFLILGLSKPKSTAPEIPSTQETTSRSGEETNPPSVPVKITSYIGTVKSIDGTVIQLEVSKEKNPGIQDTQIINVNVTKQTALIQRIRPAQIPADITDPSQLFKQKSITIKDLQIGDEIIAAGGGEDLFGQTQFNAASIMKIIITS